MDMLATVEKILKIDAHPNADSLEIATVLGYQCIVRKGAHSVGEAIVFIQPDSVLPADREWASEVIKYTSGNGRVKAVRLRGSWSMGLVMPLSILAAGEPRLVLDGQEVSKMLGIIAYEAPIPKNLNAKGGLPFGMPRTDESRWQNVRDLDTLLGNLVDVTLKVDGSSFTAYCVLPGDHPGDAPLLGITSRSLDLKLDGSNNWLDAAAKTEVLAKLAAYCQAHGVSLALRGEVYGKGIQTYGINPHARQERGVAFFSTWDIREHRYHGRNDTHYYRRVCAACGLSEVALLEEGVPLSMALIKKYDEELESIGGEPFEGVVIKGGGFSFKVVNKRYDSKK
jgi:RNA ligase (TIGR02306 family)